MIQSVIVVERKDNVATALRELKEGETVDIGTGEVIAKLALREPIPQGFKVALGQISEGKPVIKYGEVIGLATRNIERGSCVHVHNLEGLKGRGDKL